MADALQQLMDERDTARDDALSSTAAAARESGRAEKAEEKYAAAIEWNAHLNARADANMQRAEAAEAKRHELETRAAGAEDKLSMFARKVREWYHSIPFDGSPGFAHLAAILAEFGGGEMARSCVTVSFEGRDGGFVSNDYLHSLAVGLGANAKPLTELRKLKHGSPQCDQGCELGCRYNPEATP
ncbi:MAG TPA: hypothetical protein VGO53_16340 [Steroidobacteraceae bacterium]|nr:hypothetical protein [Steroidobacteraceae bacterium]